MPSTAIGSLLLWAAASASSSSIVNDEPYIEDVSFRIQPPGQSPIIASWTQSPVALTSTAVAGVLSSTTAWAPAWFAPASNGSLAIIQGSWNDQQVYGANVSVTIASLSEPLSPSHRLVISAASGELVAVANDTFVSIASCSVSSDGTASCPSSASSCRILWQSSAPSLQAVVWWPDQVGSSGVFLLASDAELLAARPPRIDEPTACSTWAWMSLATNESFAAVALDASDPLLATAAVGSDQRLILFRRGSPWPTVQRWEWVTDLVQGNGAPIDGPIASLTFDACGTLWIATPCAVNLRFGNGTFARAAGLEGLPFNETNIVETQQGWISTGSNGTIHPAQEGRGRSVLVQPQVAGAVQGRARLLGSSVWIGSSLGLMRYVPSGPEMCASMQWPPSRDQVSWRFFAGPRYLATPDGSVSQVTAVATLIAPTSSLQDAALVVIANGGASLIASQTWTLASKAAYYEATVLPRHDIRFGFMTDCQLSSPGNISGPLTCSPGPSDGIWTSVALAADAAQLAIDPSNQAALDRVLARLGALQMLFNVTGIPGYPARSMAAPTAPQNGSGWIPSTTMPGWTWRGDTSSDSFTGDVFGLALAARALTRVGAAGNSSSAAAVLGSAVRQVVQNGYYLIGETGQPTQWGKWAPLFVNGLRSWSDQRGLNSLQMLSYLAVAASLGQDERGVLTSAWEELTNSSNQYLTNILNEAIQAPIDNNYSDLELAFLPFYMWLASPRGLWLTAPSESSIPQWPADAVTGIVRSWTSIRTLRSSLWNVMYLASALAPNTSCNTSVGAPSACLVDPIAAEAIGARTIMHDAVWNLRSWPLEQITWFTTNTERRDLDIDPDPDDDGHFGDQSVAVLRASERSQYRWNANAHIITASGDDGRTEFDPGAFLAPYWLARLHGLLE